MTPIAYLKLGIIAVLFAVIGFFIVDFNHTKSELVKARAEVLDLGSKLNTQNDAVQALKNDSDSREAAGRVLLDAAQKKNAIQVSKAEVIYASLPSIPTDDCRSALALGNVK